MLRRKAILLPELQPYAELPESLRYYERHFTVEKTAREIAGDVDWQARYEHLRDAVLVRGRLAARMLPEIAQRMLLLADDNAELKTVEVSPQPWVNSPLWYFGRAHWLLVPPGFRGAFQKAAERLGLDFPKLPFQTLPELKCTLPCEWNPVVDTILNSPVGLFRFSGAEAELADRIISVRRYFPRDYCIVVVTRTGPDGERLKRQIQQVRKGRSKADFGSIYVTQTQRLHRRLSVDGHGTPNYTAGKTIVLVTDASLVGAQTAAQVLGSLPHVRLYGFIARRAKPEPYVQRRIEAFFGFRALELHDTPGERAPANVVFQRNRHSVPGRRELPALKIKRVLIWENPRRNRLIERVAIFLTVLKSQKALTRWDFEPEIRELRRHLPPHPTVLVLVESDMQLTALDGLCCAGWARATLDDGAQLCWLAGSPDNPVMIATFLAAAKLRRAFDVVIRADGGPGVPAVVQRLVRLGQERVTNIVDIEDRNAPQLRKWVKSRRAVYQELGWVEPPDGTIELVDRLVAAATKG